ncbi:MAG: histidine kinase [Candidatus Acidiferrum sp.]
MTSIFGRRGMLPLGLLGFITFAAGIVLFRNRLVGLPYHDSFAAGKSDEWHALGGTWELADGTMRNESDERGAKLIAGSADWRDYSLQADVQLLGEDGDAGLIVRSSDEENGVDSYNGYYAGLRNHDNTLVLGRADHGWIENQAIPIPGGMHPFRWYHLTVFAVGCEISASAADPFQNVTISAAMADKECKQSGRIGLRSYSSGGVWRNVQALRATSADLEAFRSKNPPTIRIARTSIPRSLPPQGSNAPRSETGEQSSLAKPEPLVAQEIAGLRLASTVHPAVATVRGVVVLTSPALYVQDSTGGAAVMEARPTPLKVGDEIEVTGKVEPHDFSLVLRDANVRLLWTRAPIPPLSVTASQAATGAFDATFIELDGYLVSKEGGPGNTMILALQKGEQSFRAIMHPGRGDVLFRKLKTNSLLRLRGICVVDSEYTQNLTPFVLLVPSADDVTVLAGPPWWSAGHVAAIAAVVLILLLAAQLLYSRVEHWRLHAVLEERERLAHEMHDTIAQSFAGIGFQLQAIRNDLQDKNPAVLRQLDLASDLVRHSHNEARRSIATLRPEPLESIGLLPALDRTARRMVDGGSVQVTVSGLGSAYPIPVRTSDALYKIGQEAIANAIRHARPASLTISLSYEKNEVHLVVKDDGVGFSSGADSLGFGLRGMRKRAESISAALEIESSPGNGTRVRVAAPLPPRFTFKSWPAYIWQYLKERRPHAQDWEHSHPYSYRR